MAHTLNIYFIPHFLAITIIIFLYVVLLKRRVIEHKKLDRETILFAMLLASILVWDVGEVLLNASTNIALASLWAKISNVGLAAIPTILLHFVLGYPQERIPSRKKRTYIVSFLYVIAALWIILILFTSQVIVIVPAEESENILWTYDTDVPLFFIFALYIIVYLLMSIYLIYREFKSLKDPDTRRQAKFMFIGMSIVMFFLFTGELIAESLGAPPNMMDSFSGLFLSIFFSIAAFKYNLMDLQIIVERSVAYTILTLILAVIFIVLEEIIENTLGNIMGKEMGSSIFPNIISAIIVSFVMDPIKTRVEKFAERIFPARSFE